MKICAIVSEFNPFHNGHKYLIERAKELSHCDAVLCIMSGSFTQRGEICILDKYARAKHAVLCGADAVLELPSAFSVAPAEIFARGAIKILSSIPGVTSLAFGCETADKEKLVKSAKILINEDEAFKNVLNEELNKGESYIKSYQKAFERAGGDGEILSKPNNVLAIEYIKAVLKSGKNLDFYPVKRFGADFNDLELKGEYSSANAIRKNIGSPSVKRAVPEYVYRDLADFSEKERKFKEFTRLILTRTSAENLCKVYGCGEGLENKLKSLEGFDYDKIIEGATNKRYSSSRIKRILCANFLGINQEDCEKFLNTTLYLKPLAVKKQRADDVLSALSKADFPLIVSGSDKLKLGKIAQKCIDLDEFAYKQWLVIAEQNGETLGMVLV